MYDLVSRTDPGFVSSVFGLARCHAKERDRRAAVQALERIPPASALFVRSRIEAARTLVGNPVGSPAQRDAKPSLEDLISASTIAESLALDGLEKFTLTSQILASAVEIAAKSKPSANGAKILGQPVEERSLRFGLEDSYRSLARLATGEERILFIDLANMARPRTLL
jgi:serine/threonine-protein kinase PknG